MSQFNHLSCLEKLDCTGIPLTTIHCDTFACLHNLKELNLSSRTSIGPNLFKNLKNLKKLDLFVNQLTFIHPDAFASLQNLQELNLRYGI